MKQIDHCFVMFYYIVAMLKVQISYKYENNELIVHRVCNSQAEWIENPVLWVQTAPIRRQDHGSLHRCLWELIPMKLIIVINAKHAHGMCYSSDQTFLLPDRCKELSRYKSRAASDYFWDSFKATANWSLLNQTSEGLLSLKYLSIWNFITAMKWQSFQCVQHQR